jgi:predicted esterase
MEKRLWLLARRLEDEKKLQFLGVFSSEAEALEKAWWNASRKSESTVAVFYIEEDEICPIDSGGRLHRSSQAMGGTDWAAGYETEWVNAVTNGGMAPRLSNVEFEALRRILDQAPKDSPLRVLARREALSRSKKDRGPMVRPSNEV